MSLTADQRDHQGADKHDHHSRLAELLRRQFGPPTPGPLPTVPDCLDELMVRVERVGISLFRLRKIAAGLDARDSATIEAARRDAECVWEWGPGSLADMLVGDQPSGMNGAGTSGKEFTTAERMGGSHLTELLEELRIADKHWQRHLAVSRPAPESDGAAPPKDSTSPAVSNAHRASEPADAPLLAALERATQHVAVLLLWHKALRATLATRVRVDQELSRWALSAENAATVKAWLALAPPRFEDVSKHGALKLKPINLQPLRSARQSILFGAPRWRRSKWAACLTFVWGPVVAILLLWAAVNLLARAGVADVAVVPLNLDAASSTGGGAADTASFLGLVAVFGLVASGAALHVASKWLGTVNFDSGLEIQGKDSRYSDWLAVRWTAILRILIPITATAAVVYLTKQVPTSIDDVSTALLAGFGADSLLRTGLARMEASDDLDVAKRELEVKAIVDERAALLAAPK